MLFNTWKCSTVTTKLRIILQHHVSTDKYFTTDTVNLCPIHDTQLSYTPRNLQYMHNCMGMTSERDGVACLRLRLFESERELVFLSEISYFFSNQGKTSFELHLIQENTDNMIILSSLDIDQYLNIFLILLHI